MTESAPSRTPRRRTVLGILLGGAAAAPLGATAVRAQAASRVMLDHAKWSPRNHDLVARLIAETGDPSPVWSAARRPYAVFDWDNTSIMNDTQEALLMHQINTLSFKLTPAQFGAVIRQNVPPGPFSAESRNAAGAVVTLEDVCADLDADYAWLHAAYAGLAGKRPLEEVVKADQFQDFRAKLLFLYEAVNDTHGVAVGYPWVIYLLSGMTVAEVSALTEQSNDAALGAALVKTKYTSPAATPGRSGIIGVTHFHGIRLCTEIATLMDALRANGIDVYVSTASLEQVVAVFATNPKYGYRVARENVLGLRLEQSGDTLLNAYRKDWPLNWGPGKTAVIKREIVAKRGYGPILVAGDSDGDYDMLRDFPDTRIGLIVNRMKKGPIGELSKAAADNLKSDNPRFLLQGRQESTGNWLPAETSIKLGKNAPQLLA